MKLANAIEPGQKKALKEAIVAMGPAIVALDADLAKRAEVRNSFSETRARIEFLTESASTRDEARELVDLKEYVKVLERQVENLGVPGAVARDVINTLNRLSSLCYEVLLRESQIAQSKIADAIRQYFGDLALELAGKADVVQAWNLRARNIRGWMNADALQVADRAKAALPVAEALLDNGIIA
jgi:hypothetical protein